MSPEASRVHRLRSTCRICDGTRLERFLELGPQPLANAFLSSEAEFAEELRFPLDLYYCHDCTLVQLLDVIDPELLFRNYLYVTGTSETMASHNQAYAATVVSHLGLGPEDLVVEVASNDGSLMLKFQERGVRTLGVEPARNIAQMARERGVETVCEFFGREAAARVRRDHGVARAVVANNVLAHVDDTRGFLGGAAELVSEDGQVIFEVPYLEEFIERLEYDTVYHEHLCYFSLTALDRLCEVVGLRIVRVDRVPVHGGSLRVYAAPQAAAGEAPSADARALLDAEAARGNASIRRYLEFAASVRAHRLALRELLDRLKQQGLGMAGYGAPAKGNTMLNYCGVGRDDLAFTADRSPLKVGLYTPGMHIPVRDVSAIGEERPDVLVILAWNFAEEIMRQQAGHAERGGRFVLPLPEPRVVGS